jgi:hypothetical protein
MKGHKAGLIVILTNIFQLAQAVAQQVDSLKGLQPFAAASATERLKAL